MPYGGYFDTFDPNWAGRTTPTPNTLPSGFTPQVNPGQATNSPASPPASNPNNPYGSFVSGINNPAPTGVTLPGANGTMGFQGPTQTPFTPPTSSTPGGVFNMFNAPGVLHPGPTPIYSTPNSGTPTTPATTPLVPPNQPTVTPLQPYSGPGMFSAIAHPTTYGAPQGPTALNPYTRGNPMADPYFRTQLTPRMSGGTDQVNETVPTRA